MQTALLCDQYDCVGLLKSWYQNWVVNEGGYVLAPERENWTFISWVFGDEVTLDRVAKKVARSLKLGPDRRRMNRLGGHITEPMPPSILSKLSPGAELRISARDGVREELSS